jgi:hypothetical protein
MKELIVNGDKVEPIPLLTRGRNLDQDVSERQRIRRTQRMDRQEPHGVLLVRCQSHGPALMKQTEWDPACSCCGARPPAELVRAGGRDFWICSACVERPLVEDMDGSDVRCTFCEERIRQVAGSGAAVERQIVAARHGAVRCRECTQVCRQLISEGRALRASRP